MKKPREADWIEQGPEADHQVSENADEAEHSVGSKTARVLGLGPGQRLVLVPWFMARFQDSEREEIGQKVGFLGRGKVRAVTVARPLFRRLQQIRQCRDGAVMQIGSARVRCKSRAGEGRLRVACWARLWGRN
jgi:hypothetical protein